MSYRRLSLMLIGLLAILFPVIFLIVKILEGNYDYTVTLIFFIIILLYTYSFVAKEFIKIKKDKKDGLQSDIMTLFSYNLLYKSSRDNMPPIQIATFKLCDKEEYLTLSGDYSQINLVKGRQYSVRYYKNNGILTEITDYRGKKKKIWRATSRISSKRNYNQYDTNFGEVLLVYVIYGSPTFLVYWGIYKLFGLIQKEVHMSSSDLLLVQPKYLILVFVLFGFITFMLIIIGKDPLGTGIPIPKLDKLYSKIGLNKALLILSLTFIVVLSVLFNTYTKISEKDIQVKGIINDTSYTFSNIDHISVYYSNENIRKRRKFKLNYNIYLDNNNYIKLRDSNMFWENILELNDIFIQNGVKINKAHISYYDSTTLIRHENLDVYKDMDKIRKLLIVDNDFR